MLLMFQIRHLVKSIPHIVPQHWVNHLKQELFSPIQLCWRVHSDSCLCFQGDEKEFQGAQEILWTIGLLTKEENQSMINYLILTGHL